MSRSREGGGTYLGWEKGISEREAGQKTVKFTYLHARAKEHIRICGIVIHGNKMVGDPAKKARKSQEKTGGIT